MHITCRILGFKQHYLLLNWRYQRTEYRANLSPQWSKYYLGTPVAEHFYFDNMKAYIYIYAFSLPTKERFRPKTLKGNRVKRAQANKKILMIFPWISYPCFQLTNTGWTIEEWEILLYLHLNIQIHLCRIFISSLTIWVMADLNLINQIIFEDISIQSLRWILNLRLAIIQWSGFILKTWSFVLLNSEKGKEGDFHQNLILVLNQN